MWSASAQELPLEPATLLSQVNQLYEAGKYAEAIPVAERYIKIIQAHHNTESPEYAVALNNLGELLRVTNRFAEAEPLMRRALAIDEKILGPEHPNVAIRLSNLALLLQATIRSVEAERLFRRALAINEKTLGPEHLSVGRDLTNLADVLRTTGRPSEAEPVYQRALKVFEHALGPNHPSVTTALNNLAVLYEETGRFADAEKLKRDVLAVDEKSLGPEHPNVARDLSNLATLLMNTDRFAEAEPLLRRALDIDQRNFGPEHVNVAIRLNNLAQLLQATNRLPDAEAAMRQALAIDKKSLGPDHPNVGRDLNNLAELLRITNRPSEAEPLIRRALVVAEKNFGPNHPDVARALNNLALLLHATNRLSDSEPLYRRVIAILEGSLGSEHPSVAIGLSNLARLLHDTNRMQEAELLMRRALAIGEKSPGPEHPDTAIRLNNLIGLLQDTDRLFEAEPLYRRVITIFEKSFGSDHPNVATALNNLAGLLLATNRIADAEPLVRRALAINEKSLGALHPSTAVTLNGLALLLQATSRLDEAERAFRRALAIDENSFGSDHPSVAVKLANLGILLHQTDRSGEAEKLMRRRLLITEKSLGPEHPQVARSLNDLALLLQATNRSAEAEPLMRRALAIDEKGLGPTHPNVAIRLNSLASLLEERGDWAGGVEFHARAKPILIGRADTRAVDRTGLARTALASSTGALRAHARALHRADADGDASREEAFELAQWALQTGAADALTHMSVRFARGAGTLAQIVRDRQNLAGHRESEDKRLLVAIGKADAKEAEEIRASIANLEAEIDAIDRKLAAEFPEYADLANPNPLTLAIVQDLLRTDETLIVLLDVPRFGRLPEEMLLWAVTKTQSRWISIPLGTAALAERVARLRCGLDDAAWEGEGQERCSRLLKTFYSPGDASAGKLLPFDLDHAHDLYQVLFGRVEDLIKGKRLLIAPSGPLTALPFQVLVTDRPATAIPASPAGYANAPWFAKRYAITVLPSVASLKALRQVAKASKASRPFIGFGNPLLAGPLGRDKRAWERQSCKVPAAPMKVASRSMRSAIPTLFRAGLANVEEVRALYPLPETADELCAVARASGTGEDSLYLGEKVSERTVKALSADGTLARTRVVHFATHGLLAGETELFGAAKAEPALILTPPAQASEEDDGLLTASEVAQLRLNADWVVLSACNTAAGDSDRPGAEALSGLARAFFYAGARALLVSHWAVNSEATVRLITNAFAEQKTAPNIGRAEALRRSMVASIDKGGIWAHPAIWAPFAVVGEGAADATAQFKKTPAKIKPSLNRQLKHAAHPEWQRELWRQ